MTDLTDLTANASPAGEDLLYSVDDPSGTPAPRKITITSLAAFINALSATLTNKTIDSASNTLTLDLSEGTLTGTLAEFNTALSDGSFASLAGSESLTNKTVAGGTVTGTNTITMRWDAAADWTSGDPTLAAGEIGIESDTGAVKIGDGSTAWTSLEYSLRARMVSGTLAHEQGGLEANVSAYSGLVGISAGATVRQQSRTGSPDRGCVRLCDG